MTKDEALEAAYLAGFNASGEGYNGEYGVVFPETDAVWCKDRDNELTAIKQALAAQQEHEPENEPYVSLASVQEPVPVFELQKSGWEIICDLDWIQTLPFGTKLYTTPPAAPKVVDCHATGVCVQSGLRAEKPAPVPTSWMEMVTANLVREGVNKHKARELAEHFYGLAAAAQLAPVQEPVGEAKHMNGVSAAHTQAIFLKSEVPVGTKLYTTPPAAPVLEGRDWSLLEATQESLREHMAEIKRLKAAQPAVPDAIGPNDDELPAYAAGWNDCRQAMMEMMK